jgi:toxin ParE1/3/4
MQRLRVEFRPSANVDIATIFEYIFEGSQSSAVALRFIRRIRDRCERIGDVPLGGRPRDDLAPGLRTVPFERSAVIAYIVEGDAVQITNIFYGGRDYEAIYRGQTDDGTPAK